MEHNVNVVNIDDENVDIFDVDVDDAYFEVM